jgi:hypothetical protein
LLPDKKTPAKELPRSRKILLGQRPRVRFNDSISQLTHSTKAPSFRLHHLRSNNLRDFNELRPRFSYQVSSHSFIKYPTPMIPDLLPKGPFLPAAQKSCTRHSCRKDRYLYPTSLTKILGTGFQCPPGLSRPSPEFQCPPALVAPPRPQCPTPGPTLLTPAQSFIASFKSIMLQEHSTSSLTCPSTPLNTIGGPLNPSRESSRKSSPPIRTR